MKNIDTQHVWALIKDKQNSNQQFSKLGFWDAQNYQKQQEIQQGSLFNELKNEQLEKQHQTPAIFMFSLKLVIIKLYLLKVFIMWTFTSKWLIFHY